MDKPFKIKALACAVMITGLTWASAAPAVTFTVSGATLPIHLYYDEFSSLANSAHTWNYAGVGSGDGRAGFFNNDATRVYGSMGQTVQFAASDAAITSAEYNYYIGQTGKGNLLSASGHGRMIQIPMFSFPLLIVAKSASNAADPLTLPALTKSQLCGVMSGQITNWNQISPTAPNRSFTVIVRQDSSGTTTLLTRYLQQVCNSSETWPVVFNGNGVFANNFPGGYLPANFFVAPGDTGIQNAVETIPEAIAYLGPDPAYTPQGAYTLSLQNHNASTGTEVFAPTEANVQLALGGALTYPEGPLVVDPANPGYTAATNPAYPLNWVKLVSNPSNGYPIVGTTNLILSQCYADGRPPGQPSATEAALRTFLMDHYANSDRIRDHGFVPLPPSLTLAIRQTFLVGSRHNALLAIGSGSAYCNSVMGR